MFENTKQHSQMGGTPGLGWNSACRLAALTEDSVACLSPCGQMPELHLRTHKDDYLPHPVQFIQQYNPHLLIALSNQ